MITKMTPTERMIEHFTEQMNMYRNEIMKSENFVKKLLSYNSYIDNPQFFDEVIAEENNNINYYRKLIRWYDDSIAELKK